ncbi:hypothetical protein NT6N_03600 [Oceaniferula spumae]|uniref:Uncharacterized protein n=1 Tax=Oceaniferula spumae TaxID=2979115 RepID=A0AAT9FH71_9BACT
MIRSANDLSEVAKKIAADGVEFFRSNLGKLPLLSSVRAVESSELTSRDETHYFLVPYRLSESDYALYTHRVLPEGVAPENALPKARIFHLPNMDTLAKLEELITEQLKDDNLRKINSSAPLADRLDLIANEIDKQSNRITGGLVLIGGVVAIANPLLGVGIAAKALLPTLGSKLSKHGISHATDWLREKKQKASDRIAGSEAKKAVKKLPSEVQVDPVLTLLESALSTPTADHDPSFEFSQLMNDPSEAMAVVHTAEAVSCIYEDCLQQPVNYTEAKLDASDVAWLKSLAELGSRE